jgi:predicted proteasome-type protease
VEQEKAGVVLRHFAENVPVVNAFSNHYKMECVDEPGNRLIIIQSNAAIAAQGTPN